MNKRSAMMMAAGLVLTLVIGGVAISAGLTGPTASAATPRVVQHRRHHKPIVKTYRKTITVHKQAPSSGAATYAAPPVATGAPMSSPYPATTHTQSSSGGYHDGGGSDDGGYSGGGGGDD